MILVQKYETNLRKKTLSMVLWIIKYRYLAADKINWMVILNLYSYYKLIDSWTLLQCLTICTANLQ